MFKPEELHQFWQLDPMRQTFIRIMHPRVSDLVYDAIKEHDGSILKGHWNEALVLFIGDYMRNVQELIVSDDQVVEALQSLNDEGLIDWYGNTISAIYSPHKPRRACVY